jgi:hypothetical protein
LHVRLRREEHLRVVREHRLQRGLLGAWRQQLNFC